MFNTIKKCIINSFFRALPKRVDDIAVKNLVHTGIPLVSTNLNVGSITIYIVAVAVEQEEVAYPLAAAGWQELGVEIGVHIYQYPKNHPMLN